MSTTLSGPQCVLENSFRFDDAGIGRGFAGPDVPQRPRGDVDQRVGRQRGHVDVVGVGPRQLTHRLGVANEPSLQRVGVVRVVGGKAGRQRLDQATFDRAGPATRGQLQLHPRPRQRRGEIHRVESLPRLVVVRADRVGDAPSRRSERGIEFQGTFETPNGLFVVERVRPHEAPVEPDLRLGRRRLDRAMVGAEVEVRLGSAQRNTLGSGHIRTIARPLAGRTEIGDTAKTDVRRGGVARLRRARRGPVPVAVLGCT